MFLVKKTGVAGSLLRIPFSDLDCCALCFAQEQLL